MQAKPLTKEELKSRIGGVARQYGVKSVSLFGSYARGDATPESDVDICIDRGQIRDLFQLSGFHADLEETLGTKVDVITTLGLKDDFRQHIAKELTVIYEQYA